MFGKIFNIQKFCLHDGPGIRTTVFFKGCNLRCAWCANPESQEMDVQLTLDSDKCSGCGRCVNICPTKAREVIAGKVKLDLDRCNGCGLCIGECPVKAIGREGQNISAYEVAREVLKDRVFYAHSGGGVTFSGGEVLLQQKFATELVRLLRKEGVHVAVETAAAVSQDCFRAFLQEIDYVLVDLKHYDTAKHFAETGVGNEEILCNIRCLKASGKDFLVRIPVIPGFNDALEDARGFAQILKDMSICDVQLLPFHQLGECKYALLGRDYAYAGEVQLHSEDLNDYIKVFQESGIRARL